MDPGFAMPTRPARPLPVGLALLLAALCACRPGVDQSGHFTPTTQLTATPILTPTPAFQGRVLDLTVHTAGQPGDWLVIGLLENRSDFAVDQIQLLVTLRDANEQILAETTVLTALPHLAPAEITPFQARFQGVGAVSGADARVLVARRTSIQRGDVQVSEPEVFLGEDGDTLLLGEVANLGDQPLALDGLAYLGLDEQGALWALAHAQHAPTWLEASASRPFLAQVEDDHTHLRWIAFSDALPATAPLQQAVALQGPPILQWTDQGRPFAIGELINHSEQSRNAGLLLVVRHGDQVLSLASLRAPFPLGVGERLPFGQAEFPGLSLRLGGIDREAVALEAWVDPRASTPSSEHRVQLDVRIHSMEGLGSAVFLRGSVTNPQSVSLSRPSLHAALRTTEGRLLTAGWRQLAPRLAGGEQVEFVLDLPFPAEEELALAEFDVLGFGLEP